MKTKIGGAGRLCVKVETITLATNTPDSLAAAQAEAARLLAAGEAVALPTETVYGLAADALNPEAVTKIFEAKERPLFDPLICHLPDDSWLDRLAEIPPEDRTLVNALAERFWPGPLTMVLPRKSIVPDIVTAGLDSVAVRKSAHPVFRSICALFGKPLAAPSANRFGRISPTTAAHVRSELGERISLIVDGGPTKHGIESTIVAVENGNLRLLRAGPITPDELAVVWMTARASQNKTPSEPELHGFYARLGVSLSAMQKGESNIALEAPGLMACHYAPRTPLRLLPQGTHFISMADNPIRLGSLAFQTPSHAAHFEVEEILSSEGDLREAAATLFAKLRRLDEANLDLILAETVPTQGLGLAIMDRLRKASAGSVAETK